MAEIIIMPKQGLQMTEGTIMRWLVDEGGPVVENEPLFEMETDKLTITINAACGGTLLKILREVGDAVPITEPIAVVGQPGEDISSVLQNLQPTSSPEPEVALSQPEKGPAGLSSQAASGDEKPGFTVSAGSELSQFASPRAKMTAQNKGVNFAQVPGTGPDGLVIERDVLDYSNSSQPKASPLARKVADINQVDLDRISGSGSHGKIMSVDVLEAIAAKVESRIGSSSRGETKIALSGMRKVVASRMKTSLTEMAQASHRLSVDMTEAVRMRGQYKKAGHKVSYNDIVLRCVATALTEYPMMNSSWTDDGITLRHYVNLGVAVAVDDGLLVPVIKNADLMKLGEIAECSALLAEKAKNQTLSPDEYSGGTFTVSNLGMFDIEDFTAIVNPPEVGILAVGKMEKRAVVIEDETGDQVIVRPMMRLSLTYDHRVVDGAPAAAFLKRIKALLENPLMLI